MIRQLISWMCVICIQFTALTTYKIQASDKSSNSSEHSSEKEGHDAEKGSSTSSENSEESSHEEEQDKQPNVFIRCFSTSKRLICQPFVSLKERLKRKGKKIIHSPGKIYGAFADFPAGEIKGLRALSMLLKNDPQTDGIFSPFRVKRLLKAANGKKAPLLAQLAANLKGLKEVVNKKRGPWKRFIHRVVPNSDANTVLTQFLVTLPLSFLILFVLGVIQNIFWLDSSVAVTPEFSFGLTPGSPINPFAYNPWFYVFATGIAGANVSASLLINLCITLLAIHEGRRLVGIDEGDAEVAKTCNEGLLNEVRLVQLLESIPLNSEVAIEQKLRRDLEIFLRNLIDVNEQNEDERDRALTHTNGSFFGLNPHGNAKFKDILPLIKEFHRWLRKSLDEKTPILDIPIAGQEEAYSTRSGALETLLTSNGLTPSQIRKSPLFQEFKLLQEIRDEEEQPKPPIDDSHSESEAAD